MDLESAVGAVRSMALEYADGYPEWWQTARAADLERAFGRLAQTSADVDADGKSTPGRGPIALSLNQAKSALSGALALADFANRSDGVLRAAALATVGQQVLLAAAFASRAMLQGSVVGSG